MPEERRDPKPSSSLQKVYDQVVDSASKTVHFIVENAEQGLEQVQDLFQTTATHVSEKTDAARRFVHIGMAIAEVEEHLSRLYPQIGKLLTDLSERQLAAPLLDKELRSKLDLAIEYRERLNTLRRDLKAATPEPKPQS